MLYIEIIIGKFDHISEVWIKTPGEVTRLLRFNGNGCNSVNVERNTLQKKKKNYEQKPCGRKEHHLFRELKEDLNVRRQREVGYVMDGAGELGRGSYKHFGLCPKSR